MNEIIISNATYVKDNSGKTILATIDGEVISVPMDPANRHYAEIMRQVDAGELTIKDAD